MFEHSLSFSINLYNRVVNSNFVQRLFTNRNLTEEDQGLISIANSRVLSPDAQEILDNFGGNMIEARNYAIRNFIDPQIEEEFNELIGETIHTNLDGAGLF